MSEQKTVSNAVTSARQHQIKCVNGHDFVHHHNGTAKCTDCGELADITETGAARHYRDNDYAL